MKQHRITAPRRTCAHIEKEKHAKPRRHSYDEIASLHLSGLGLAELARRFGCNRSTISYALNIVLPDRSKKKKNDVTDYDLAMESPDRLRKPRREKIHKDVTLKYLMPAWDRATTKLENDRASLARRASTEHGDGEST